MDNVRFHHFQATQSILNQNEIDFIYLAVYSHKLNHPIRELFPRIKARYAVQKDNFITLAEGLAYVFNGDFRNECANFWLDMLTWIEKTRRI
ncbi:hypothetical protein HZS_3301 [Henneguya salminicola]|nr:hypothetical protein HZS_3301 [Henneguya salminicola]